MAYPRKINTLKDGTRITAHELSAKLGITTYNARARLLLTNDPKELFKPKGGFTPNKFEKKTHNKTNPARKKVKKTYKESKELRQIYDPMFRLALKAI